MKNLAILAVVLGSLGSNANADELPNLVLAMNNSQPVTWAKPASAARNTALAAFVELKIAESVEQMSTGLEKQLEEKIAKDLEYAIK